MTVTLIPKTKRAKQKVNAWGSVFRAIQSRKEVIFSDKKDWTLYKSVQRNYHIWVNDLNDNNFEVKSNG